MIWLWVYLGFGTFTSICTYVRNIGRGGCDTFQLIADSIVTLLLWPFIVIMAAIASVD